MGIAWGFDGEHSTDVRPPHVSATKPWAKNESAPGANDGTRYTAAIANRIVGNIRALAIAADITLTEDSDDDLKNAITALVGLTAPASHNHNNLYYTEGEVDDLVAALAALASPAFTGTPTAPTADPGTNTEQLATTAFVAAAIASLISSAPGALDTLAELAAALGDDANFAATVTNALAGKQPLNSELSAIAALTTQSFGRSLLTAADAASAMTLLSIVNNLTTNDANKPLSAAQGKALKDQIDALDDTVASGQFVNGKLSWTVAGNALTVAVKTLAGADPSAGSPVYIRVEDTWYTLTSAMSLVVSSGSTLGAANNTPFRLWCVAFDDGGTLRLGVINTVGAASGLIAPVRAGLAANSTAEGGAGAADNAQVFYTGTAVTAKLYAVLGCASWESGIATAGTWSAGPTREHVYRPGSALPGDRVQKVRSVDGSAASGSTTMPYDDTIPQSGEGVQFMTRAITPTSAANLLSVRHAGNFNLSNTAGGGIAAMFRDSIADAIAVCWAGRRNVADGMYNAVMGWFGIAGSTAATTFKIRAGSSVAGTVYFNSDSAGRTFGGAMNSVLEVEEIMT